MWKIILIVSWAFFSLSPAAAEPIEMETGLPSPEVAITFDEIILTPSTPITDQYAPFGVVFSDGLLYNPGTANMSDDIIGFEGPRLANFYPVTPIFSIIFLSPVSEAVVGVLAPDITSFTALLEGMFVESFQNSRPTQAQGFYGFGGIVFDEIRIDAHSRFDEGRALLDNIQFATVPEPSAASMLCLGILAAAAASGMLRPQRL